MDDTCRYCSNCGAAQHQKVVTDIVHSWSALKQAAIFYSWEVISCCFFTYYKDIQTLLGLAVFYLCTALVTGYFVKLNLHVLKFTFVCREFKWKKLLTYSLMAITAAIFVHYVTGWLNHKFFSTDYSYYLFFKPYRYGIALMVLFTAILPAFLEELAYRGYLLQVLRKAMDDQQAIFITSVLFALVHLSFMSLFWLVPFALALGFIALKEKTIWYGVVIHFLFNLTACLFEIFMP
jgi:membrane protease YdiL (CAAX protease family)